MGRYIYHLSGLRKHVENSLRGIRRAARLMFRWIDLDLLITKADPDCRHHKAGETCRGHIVGCHWMRPMIHDGFFDPAGKLHPRTRVADMTLDEALRLYTRDGYRIRKVEVLLWTCGLRGVGAYVEPKDDARFELDWPWVQMKAAAKKRGTRLRARAIKNFPTYHAGLRRVRAARRNGVRARTIRG